MRDIEGGIGTGGSSGAWIATACLIGEIIVIPMAGLSLAGPPLAAPLPDRQRLPLYLVFSARCAARTTSLPEMIVLRGLQRLRRRRASIPLAFTIVVTMLPPSESRPVGMAAFALTATFAPLISLLRLLGGYFTDNYGLAHDSLPRQPGARRADAVDAGLRVARSKMQLQSAAPRRWLGIALMAVGLAALQTVLDEGNVYDWFGSPFIVQLSLVSALALGGFLIVEFTRPDPLVNFRLLGGRNFGFGTLANFMLGFALYGSAYLLPAVL